MTEKKIKKLIKSDYTDREIKEFIDAATRIT